MRITFATLEKKKVDIAVEEKLIEDDYIVVLLDHNYPEGMSLRSSLQSMGVPVYIGFDIVASDSTPLIVLHAQNRNRTDVASRLEYSRRVYPEAEVIFIIGQLPHSLSPDGHKDPYAALGEVRIALV